MANSKNKRKTENFYSLWHTLNLLEIIRQRLAREHL